jgi:hypothetical protein
VLSVRSRGMAGEWGDFGRDLLGRLSDFYIAKESAHAGVQAPPPIVIQAPPPPAQTSGVPTGLVVAGIAAVGLLLLFK